MDHIIMIIFCIVINSLVSQYAILMCYMCEGILTSLVITHKISSVTLEQLLFQIKKVNSCHVLNIQQSLF